jgi:hypothetical protein
MASRKRRGRRRGRPQKAVQQTAAVQDLASGGSQGAAPACKKTASRGQSPPEDAQQEQSGGRNVGAGDSDVNGQASEPIRYSDDSAGIVWHRRTRDGVEDIRLTNFRARIVGDITRDDGVEKTRFYEIGALLGGNPCRFEVAAGQFRGMAWVGEHLGASAIMEPGQGMEARVRHAIQVLSKDGVTAKYIYTHTGWREIDGRMVFLHAGGAIDSLGHRLDVEVDLPEQLSRYELIAPEDQGSLRRAVAASLDLLRLAPARVMAAALGAAYRAPLGDSDITVGLWGKTGHGKTETAALVQQHYGAKMDARHLPLSWESTANTIEGVLSAAKDVLTVVDEYVPGEISAERAKLQAKSERVIRAQGNASGRGRMRSDTTLRPVRPPRGQLMSTGEEVPGGQSLRARMMAVEMLGDDVDWPALSAAQTTAAEGIYAMAMTSFIIWLADDLGVARQLFQEKRLELRKVIEADHKRTADVVAQLAAAWHMFLFFAVDVGAIDKEAAERIEASVWAGLLELSAEQSDLQLAAEPVGRFRDFIAAALATGRAHVESAEAGGRPSSDPCRWGWQREELQWRSRGECIGWLTAKGELYLEPDVSYLVATRIGSVGVSAETLGARMADAGVTVVEYDGKRRRYRPKREVKGKRQRVLHIRRASWICPAGSGANGANGADVEKDQPVQGVAAARL